MGRFKKGLFFGGLLGAGLTWMMSTTKGKEVRDQMLDHAADVYTNMRLEILESENYEKLTKSRYAKIAKAYIDKYADKHELTDDIKKTVSKLIEGQWKMIRNELKKK